jgi:hypothetical protein
MQKKEALGKEMFFLWSISPTFYEHICANILAPKKYQPMLEQKKLCVKFLCKRAMRLMLVKLTPDFQVQALKN